ncbi:hypothetical protein ACLOJK_021487 [Asimina triloba]
MEYERIGKVQVYAPFSFVLVMQKWPNVLLYVSLETEKARIGLLCECPSGSDFALIFQIWMQTGVISPSKLRLKLLGPPHQRRKEVVSNSSRTSPSKLEDVEFAKNSLLAADSGESHLDGSALTLVPTSSNEAASSIQEDQKISCLKDVPSKESINAGHLKYQNAPKGVFHQVQFSNNFRIVHPMKLLEEDNTDYDSGIENASTSSFEFHRGERILHNPVWGPFARPMPSKWNDAEKWIINRQNVPRKPIVASQMNRQAMANWIRVAPESVVPEQRGSVTQVADTKQMDSCQPLAQSSLGPANGVNRMTDQFPGHVGIVGMSRDDEENCNFDTTNMPSVRSVQMRDMGTEMTPMTSQEPSRTATPVGATTPIRSPISSIPSTPRRDAPAPSPAGIVTDDELDHQNRKDLSEKELKQKTRREIVALGVQLGKMNIAAWASKAEEEKLDVSNEVVDEEQLHKIEYENRAKAWEEAEKSKHMARYKREEVKIQAWECEERAKLEAEMKRVEAKAEQTRASAQEKTMNKIAITRQRSVEKLAAAEARRNQQAARTAQQAEYIRQTGRIPSSRLLCCTCFP